MNQTFPFTVPSDLPNGDIIFAWTWFNREQQFFMNCAAVTITGGTGGNASGEAKSKGTSTSKTSPAIPTNLAPLESPTHISLVKRQSTIEVVSSENTNVFWDAIVGQTAWTDGGSGPASSSANPLVLACSIAVGTGSTDPAYLCSVTDPSITAIMPTSHPTAVTQPTSTPSLSSSILSSVISANQYVAGASGSVYTSGPG